MSELTEYRTEKDEFFRRHPQSPLTPEQREAKLRRVASIARRVWPA